MPGTMFGERKTYLSIVQGRLRQKVDEGTVGAEKREYELKNGTKGSKWELVYKSWDGIIEDLRLKDGDFGEVLEVVFQDAILTVGVDSRYFDDIIKKLMNIDINQKVVLSPYDFESDGKKRQGMTVYQFDKVSSYYEDDKKKTINGLPPFPENWKTYKKDDWKLYSLTVKKFLKGEIAKITAKIERPVIVTTEEVDEMQDSLDDFLAPEPDDSEIKADEIVDIPEDKITSTDQPF
jgi:hypothetical protein